MHEDLETLNKYLRRFGMIDYPTIHFDREDWEKLDELAKIALENNKKIPKNELINSPFVYPPRPLRDKLRPMFTAKFSPYGIGMARYSLPPKPDKVMTTLCSRI